MPIAHDDLAEDAGLDIGLVGQKLVGGRVRAVEVEGEAGKKGIRFAVDNQGRLGLAQKTAVKRFRPPGGKGVVNGSDILAADQQVAALFQVVEEGVVRADVA